MIMFLKNYVIKLVINVFCKSKIVRFEVVFKECIFFNIYLRVYLVY